MSTEGPSLEPTLTSFTFKPEHEIRDTYGNLIYEIRLTVIHGTGLVTGISWISVELLVGSGQPIRPGGFKIEGAKFFPLGDLSIGEDETTPMARLVRALNNYFADRSAELEALKRELQKTE